MSLLGRALLLVALVCAVYAIVAALGSRRGGRRAWQRSAERAVYGMWVATMGAAAVMITALVTDDFSLKFVADYSSTTLPTHFKVSAMWGSQAGSLLLWVSVLACFSALAVWLNRNRNRELMPVVVAVLMGVAVFFLATLSFVTSPFASLSNVPTEGKGLNPLLQNEYMMAHPPILYIGYVGLAVPFAFAIAALATGRLDTTWIASTRRWTVVSWLFLGFGILLGSRWAYHELGWGGYWGWDAVENAALIPWLVATAFLHSVMVQERRGMLKVWNMVLVILTFCLAVFGTFLTRSGIVNSVHAFGETTLGPLFLGFILVLLVGSLGLLFTRLDQLRSRHALESYVSREAVFLYNNLLLVGLAFAVLWGTMFPVLSEAVQGKKITVGPGFFNQVAVPIGAALLLLTGIGPLVPWRKASPAQLWRRFAIPAAAAAVSVPLLWFLTDARGSGWAFLVFVSAVFVAVCVLGEFWRGTKVRHALGGVSWPAAAYQLVVRNRRRYGGYLVHLGVVVLFVGFAGSSAFTTAGSASLRKGESITVAGYTFTNQGAYRTSGEHKNTVGVAMAVTRPDGSSGGTMMSSVDVFKPTFERSTEVGLRSGPTRDLYLVLTGLSPDAKVATVAVYVNPLVSWLWAAGVVIVLGGLVAVWPAPRERRQEAAVPSRTVPR